MIGIGSSSLVLMAAAILVLLSGSSSSQRPATTLRTWRASLHPGVLSAGPHGDVTLDLDDEAKKKIALEVLESTAASLRAKHKRDKANERKSGCPSLAQAGDLIEAAAVFAVDPAKKKSLLDESVSIEAEKAADCIEPPPTPIAVPSPTAPPAASGAAVSPDANLPVVVLPGGCVNGMVAALFALDEADRRAYVQSANIKIDLDALSRADRILLDITPAERGGVALPYKTLQADCPEGPGGTKRQAHDLILSAYLFSDVQWRDLLKQVTSWKSSRVDFPQAAPKLPYGYVLPKPTNLLPPTRNQYRYSYPH